MHWNHNTVYYPWIKEKTIDCKTILDVGCGDGSLMVFLNNGNNQIIGIDPDSHTIEKNLTLKQEGNLNYVCCSFEEYNTDVRFDAIVFVASIHHMNMKESLRKAKSLLAPSGKLLIVGLASPSTLSDWILEVARVIPSKVISSFHNHKTTEERGIKTSYNLPNMNDIRTIIKEELSGSKIHYGLHFRYLLEYIAHETYKSS